MVSHTFYLAEREEESDMSLTPMPEGGNLAYARKALKRKGPIFRNVFSNCVLLLASGAGIICQLNARASVLAAANPVESQWNRNKTIIENIQLPHTLLSRFDLIFLMLDPQEEGHDQRLGTATDCARTAYDSPVCRTLSNERHPSAGAS